MQYLWFYAKSGWSGITGPTNQRDNSMLMEALEITILKKFNDFFLLLFVKRLLIFKVRDCYCWDLSKFFFKDADSVLIYKEWMRNFKPYSCLSL